MMEPGLAPAWADVELVAERLHPGRHLHLEVDPDGSGAWRASAEADSIRPGLYLVGVGPTPTGAVAALGAQLRRHLDL
jgi:hypothetical protein